MESKIKRPTQNVNPIGAHYAKALGYQNANNFF